MRYVAFLRAINVGGRVVKMDALRSLFESFGLADVTTFIQTGNVIFESRSGQPQALERKIAAGLRQALGYEVGAFLRTIPEVTAAARLQPFGGAELKPGATLFIGFVGTAPGGSAVRRVRALAGHGDDLQVNGREVYWLRRSATAGSPSMGSLLERAVGQPMTIRNATTVRKIAAKYGESG